MKAPTAAGGTTSRPDLLTHAGAAAIAGLSTRSIRRLWMAGHFPRPVRFEGLRGLRFLRTEIEAWVAGGVKA